MFGPKMGFVPYIKPGFDLAKAAADIYDADTTVEGLILDKHGIFTFGATAREAYDRMIRYVTMAEDYVAKHGKPAPQPVVLPKQLAAAADFTSSLRGAVAVNHGEGRFDRMISDFRTSPEIIAFLNSPRLSELARNRRLDARSVDPHQDRPDGAARPRRGQAGDLARRDPRACRRFRARLHRVFRDQQRARRDQTHHARSYATA